MLNEEQAKCVSFDKGHYLILASAGSGKTRVICERFVRLHNANSQVLCVTFSNRAAAELLHRIENRIVGSDPVWIGTFHSIAFRLLMHYGRIDSKSIIIDEWDRQRVLATLKLTEYANIYTAPEHIYQLYRTYCDEKKLIDFEYILKLLHEHLSSDLEFKTKVMQRFDYIMVDEFQDTSTTQLQILQMLCNNNLLCVGDEDQLIYTWRNASLDNILNFRRYFVNAETHTLLNNYRCSGNIVALANHVIQKNQQRFPKLMVAMKDAGIKPKLICTKRSTLGEYLNSVYKLPGSKAILVRTTALIQKCEEQLIANNVPYEIVNGQGLMNKKEFRIVLSYLRVLIAQDYTALDIFCIYPKRGIGPKKIEKIHAQNTTLLTALFAVCPEEQERLSIWYEASNIHERWNALLELTGISGEIVDQIKNYIFKYPSFELFLQNAMLTSMNDELNDNKMYVMTVHAAKGLEFDHVVVPFVVEGHFPCQKSMSSGNVEEERRLMYVAITRAISTLHLVYSLTDAPRNCFGISRFLATIPSNILPTQII